MSSSYAALPYCEVAITTDRPKGPYSLGATVILHHRVTPPPPEGAIYSWNDSIPSTFLSSAHPNLTITIPAHHPDRCFSNVLWCLLFKCSKVGFGIAIELGDT